MRIKNISIYEQCWIFIFGSLAGFVVETLFCIVKHGQIQSRSSMLFGPFNIIYGIGALVLYIGINNINNKNLLYVFLFGMISGALIEFICSWVQESAFGSVSWDYSSTPLNLCGRITLLYTGYWGILAVLWYKTLQPMFEKIIAAIPRKLGKRISVCLIIFLVFDIVISAAAVARWGMRIDGIPAANMVTIYVDRFFPDTFMEQAYNNMVHIK